MASPTVLIVGNATLELTIQMSVLPEAGQTVFDDGGLAYLPKGAGIEIASAFRALGARAVLLHKLGRDAHGKKLFDTYPDAVYLSDSYYNDYSYQDEDAGGEYAVGYGSSNYSV